MLLRLRHLILLACACATGAVASGADVPGDELLPAEPGNGEWIADTLENDALWFAASQNLQFEAVAGDLTDYPSGRRWVRVVDGKPAWVMYYVPGEILGFEVDTHHFGALATEFAFAVGQDWNDLRDIPVDFEEITGFEAKWMRLYRAADGLPRGTKFLQIRFPENTDAEAARLTEVWLRCRFDAEPGQAPVISTFPATPPAPATARNQAAPSEREEAQVHAPEDIVIEPFVVTAITLAPPAGREPPPIFTTADAKAPGLEIALPSPPPDWALHVPDLAAADKDVNEDAPRRPGLFGWIARVFRHGF